jgi:hypothetical protein
MGRVSIAECGGGDKMEDMRRPGKKYERDRSREERPGLDEFIARVIVRRGGCVYRKA